MYFFPLSFFKCRRLPTCLLSGQKKKKQGLSGQKAKSVRTNSYTSPFTSSQMPQPHFTIKASISSHHNHHPYTNPNKIIKQKNSECGQDLHTSSNRNLAPFYSFISLIYTYVLLLLLMSLCPVLVFVCCMCPCSSLSSMAPR